VSENERERDKERDRERDRQTERKDSIAVFNLKTD